MATFGFIGIGNMGGAIAAAAAKAHDPGDMLVSAFAGREKVLHAYEEAVKERYRFFSFGDAMCIL